MTLSEWIENYCEDNNIELPSGIPDEKTALEFLKLNSSGGGGGDFSVANVTIVNNAGDIIEGGLSFIYEDPDSPFDGIIVASNTIDTGTYKCPVTAAGNIISAIIDPDNISVEGDAEVTSDNIVGIIVKGDCTITINAQ